MHGGMALVWHFWHVLTFSNVSLCVALCCISGNSMELQEEGSLLAVVLLAYITPMLLGCCILLCDSDRIGTESDWTSCQTTLNLSVRVVRVVRVVCCGLVPIATTCHDLPRLWGFPWFCQPPQVLFWRMTEVDSVLPVDLSFLSCRNFTNGCGSVSFIFFPNWIIAIQSNLACKLGFWAVSARLRV